MNQRFSVEPRFRAVAQLCNRTDLHSKTPALSFNHQAQSSRQAVQCCSETAQNSKAHQPARLSKATAPSSKSLLPQPPRPHLSQDHHRTSPRQRTSQNSVASPPPTSIRFLTPRSPSQLRPLRRIYLYALGKSKHRDSKCSCDYQVDCLGTQASMNYLYRLDRMPCMVEHDGIVF